MLAEQKVQKNREGNKSFLEKAEKENKKYKKNCAEVKTEVKQMHGNSNGGCLIVKICGLKNYS